VNEVGGARGMHGRGQKSVQGLVGKPEGKRSLASPRCRWEDGIRMVLGRLAWGAWIGFDWLRIGTGGRLLSAVINLWVLAPQS
jgi:hypothetical protein